jgi:hypothetical protein
VNFFLEAGAAGKPQRKSAQKKKLQDTPHPITIYDHLH